MGTRKQGTKKAAATPQEPQIGKRTVITRDELPLSLPPGGEGSRDPETGQYLEDDAETPADIALSDVMSHFIDQHGDATVNIYRQGQVASDLTLIASVSTREFEPIMLQAPPYNGGRFRIHVRSPREDGLGSVLRINRTISVEPLPVKEAPQSDALSKMAEGISQLQQTVAQLIANQGARRDPLDTLEGIERIATIMGGNRGGSSASDLVSMLDLLERLQDIKGGGARAPAGDTNSALLREVAGFVLSEAKNQRANAAQQEAAAIESKADQAKEDPAAMEANEKMLMFKLQLRYLLREAAKGTLPEQHADRVYAMLDDEGLRLLANSQDWFQTLVKIVPECKDWHAWFSQLRARIIELATDDQVLTGATPPGSVHADQETEAARASRELGSGKPH